jgi:AraC-like DNA-binding protein/quercetin dioxygenase-like cupin family protein
MTRPSVATLGRPAAVLHGDGFSVAEVTYPAGAVFEAHAHDRTYVSLALSGRFDEQVGTRRDVVESASVVVMPAGVTHTDRIAREGHRAMVITFDEARFDPAHWQVAHGGAESRLLLRVYRAFRDAEIAAIDELLASMPDSPALPQPATRAVNAAAAYIREHHAMPISFTEVAQAMGVDRAYLARAFRRCRKETMGEMLRRLRASRAAALLGSTALAIADVALSSGFADQSHLTRVFHRQTGLTPMAYRRLVTSVQDGPRR